MHMYSNSKLSFVVVIILVSQSRVDLSFVRWFTRQLQEMKKKVLIIVVFIFWFFFCHQFYIVFIALFTASKSFTVFMFMSFWYNKGLFKYWICLLKCISYVVSVTSIQWAVYPDGTQLFPRLCFTRIEGHMIYNIQSKV